MNRRRKTSKKGLEFIKHFEGFPNGGRAYNDPAGHCTQGYGRLLHYGNCTRAELNAPAWTEKEATENLRKDIVRYENEVKNRVKVKLNQHEFDALVSAVYNLGPVVLIESESTLARELNKGNRKEVPPQLLRWNKAGGRPMAGLTRRRASEGDLWSKGDYTPRSS